MELQLPAKMQAVMDRLEVAGYEAFAVGGCVRDMLLGRTPGDWDIATSALPQQTAAVFADREVIPTGIAHGTVTVLWQGEPFEITTYRVDGLYADGRHPQQVQFTSAIGEDLARRDFTVNAMAFSPHRGFQDPFNGRNDLQKRTLRAVGDSETRFGEDALRILRGVRFAAAFGFAIEKETAAAMARRGALLQKISGERVFQELAKLCCAPWAAQALARYGHVLACLPGWGSLTPEGWQNSVVNSVAPVLPLRLAVVLWEGFGPSAAAVLKGLRCPNNVKTSAGALLDFPQATPPENRYQAKKCLALLPREYRLPAVEWRLVACPEQWEKPAALCRQVLEQNCCLCRAQLAVNGKDLLDIGCKSGENVGKLLNFLLELVLQEKAENTKEALLPLAQNTKLFWE